MEVEDIDDLLYDKYANENGLDLKHVLVTIRVISKLLL